MPPKDKPAAATQKDSEDKRTEHPRSASVFAGLCAPPADFTRRLMEQSRPTEAEKLEVPDFPATAGLHARRSQLLNNVAIAQA